MGQSTEVSSRDDLPGSDDTGVSFGIPFESTERIFTPEILDREIFPFRYTEGEEAFTVRNLFTLMQRSQQTLVQNLYIDRYGRINTPPSGPFMHEGREVRLYGGSKWEWDTFWVAAFMPDVDQAVSDIENFLSSQHADGSYGHIFYDPDSTEYFPPSRIYESKTPPLGDIITSNITQPPNIAWGVWEVAERLRRVRGDKEADAFLERNYDRIMMYYRYIYQHMVTPEGWMVTLHPWSNGDDDSPKWFPTYMCLENDPVIQQMIAAWEKDGGLAKAIPREEIRAREQLEKAYRAGMWASRKEPYDVHNLIYDKTGQVFWHVKAKWFVTDWLASRGIEYKRTDKLFMPEDQRPVDRDYDMYLLLIILYNEMDWDIDEMMKRSPFRIADPMTNTILLKSDQALLNMAARLDKPDDAAQITEWIGLSEEGLDKLWSDGSKMYYARDLTTNLVTYLGTVSSFIPLFYEHIDPYKAEMLTRILASWDKKVRGTEDMYLIPSVHPDDTSFFSEERYWSGPVWVIMNALVVAGLMQYAAMSRKEILAGMRRYGHTNAKDLLRELVTFGDADLARRIRNDSLELLWRSRDYRGGSFEYFNTFVHPAEKRGKTKEEVSFLGSPKQSWSAVTTFMLGMMIMGELGLPVQLEDFARASDMHRGNGRGSSY